MIHKQITAVLLALTSAIFALTACSFLVLVNRFTIERKEEEAPTEHWSCPYCGLYIEATSMEMIVEGMRIHDKAIYCPGDEDDYKECYN